jgi:hypothetical protein
MKYGGADLVLAGEVVKGSDTLVLPDEKRESGLELAVLERRAAVLIGPGGPELQVADDAAQSAVGQNLFRAK